MPIAIAIFADGLGFHYLQHRSLRTPLQEIFSELIPLRSLLGYSAGIFPSIWTSCYPEDHGYWTEWLLKEGYTPQHVHIRNLEWALSCLVQYGIKKVQLLCRKSSSLFPSIPRSVRRFFLYRNVETTKPFYAKNRPSLFSVFDQNEVNYCYICCRKIEDMALPTSNYDVLIFYLTEFDHLGHYKGPDSDLIIHRILDLIRVVWKLAKKADFLCLFSDHGMFPINARVDLLKVLRGLRSRMGQDYLVFLDATMARFWFFSDDASDEISEALFQVPFGHFLTPDEIRTNGLNFETNTYGDKILLLEPFYEIYPNFFHPINKSFFRGLHGYTPSSKNSNALFAAKFDLKSTEGTLLDISPTILDLLGIDPPKDWKGKSLVK